MNHLNIPFAERDLVFDIACYLESPYGVGGKMRKSRNGHLVVLFKAQDLTHDYPALQWLNMTEKDTDDALKILQTELQILELQNFLRLTAFDEEEQKVLKKQLIQHKIELYFIPCES